MEIKVLGCNGGLLQGLRSPSFLVNKEVLLDAGHVASLLTMEEQDRIRDIFITHFHLDHTKDITFLTDNALGRPDLPINIYATKVTISYFKKHFFNNFNWPDFTDILSDGKPVAELVTIKLGEKVRMKGLEITAFKVIHAVQGVGYLINDGKSSFIYSGDTGPTDELWRIANSEENLKGIIIDTSFPNEMQKLADVSGHLTPNTLKIELEKLKKKGVPIYIFHLKPNFINILKEEINDIGSNDIHLLENDQIISF